MVTRYEVMKQKAMKHRQNKTKKLVSKVSLGMILFSSSLALEQASLQLNIKPSFTKQVQAKNTPSTFLNLISGYAKDIAADNDLYASVMIAQAALESGWGNSTLASEYNNLFGIKGNYQGKTVDMDTLEDDGSGNYYGEKAGFRVYDNYGESLEDYASVLTGNNNPNSWAYKFYQGAFKSNTNSYKDATAWLTGRYATDTSYGSKLNSLIESYGLTEYDVSSGKTQVIEQKPKPVTAPVSSNANPASQTTGSATYKVQAGDSVWRIANRYGMSLDALRKANNLSGDFIYPGQVLLVNGSQPSTSQPSNPVAQYAVNNLGNQSANPSKPGSYVVKAGDSVWAISNRFGLSMDQLRSLNNLSGNYIYPGQSLNVSGGQASPKGSEQASQVAPSQPVASTAVTSTSGTYTVKAGDSVWAIANRHGVSMDALCQANGIKAYTIHAGQNLVIPSGLESQVSQNFASQTEEIVSPVTNQASSNLEETVVPTRNTQAQGTYVVQRGDSLYGIAAKHGISLDSLVALNGFSGYNQLILPGQTILV